MDYKSLDDMSGDEIHQAKIELKEMFKELISEQLAAWVSDLYKIESSKDELQKISKRHNRSKW